jgi:hypothetical protein
MKQVEKKNTDEVGGGCQGPDDWAPPVFPNDPDVDYSGPVIPDPGCIPLPFGG